MKKHKKRKRLSPAQDASLDLVNLAGVDHRFDHLPIVPGMTYGEHPPMILSLMEEMGLTRDEAEGMS